MNKNDINLSIREKKDDTTLASRKNTTQRRILSINDDKPNQKSKHMPRGGGVLRISSVGNDRMGAKNKTPQNP